MDVKVGPWRKLHEESWDQRIDAFKWWCWRRLLETLGQQGDQTSQSWGKLILNIHWKNRCWSWSCNTLATLEKTLMLGKTDSRRKRGRQRMKWLDGVTYSTDMSLSKLLEIVKVREAWHAAVCGVTNSRTRLSNWTTATHKGNPIRLTADLSADTLQASREWQAISEVLNVKNLQPRLPYLARSSFNTDGEVKSFTDKYKLKENLALPNQLYNKC